MAADTLPTRPSRRTFLVVLILALTVFGAEAQDGSKPAQTGLKEGPIRFQHSEDPRFTFVLPPNKKVTKELAQKWVEIDIEARQKSDLAAVDAQIAEAEKREPADEDALASLHQRRLQIERLFEGMKLLLEHRGSPDRTLFVKVSTPGKFEMDALVRQVKNQLSRWSGLKYHTDEDTTGKSERKRGVEHYTLDYTGQPANATDGRWVQHHIWIRPGKGGQQYVVQFLHRELSSDRNKEGLRDAELLLRLIRWH